jgi:hypothetical protein
MLQQTLSTQKPNAHSFTLLQGIPRLFFAKHWLPLQYAVGAQSFSPAQMILHWLVESLHAYGAQGTGAVLTQVPLPLQASAGLSVTLSAAQLAGLHTVPLAWSWHAPVPLQMPVIPQVDESWARHSLSGSLPTRKLPQMPSRPKPFFSVVQAWQVPVQAVLQQMPSAQKPVAHSPPALQGSLGPFFGRQTAPVQYAVGAHSALVTQLVRQLPPEQT